jgi:glycosyltransferase involved in cell wall biosynthesis
MREAAHELLGDQTPDVAVFQYGVDVPDLAMVGTRARADRSPDEPLRIVSARALLQLYRIDALLDALWLLDHDGLNFVCDLAGDGPERAALEALTRALGLEQRVTFHGHIEAAAVESLVAKADIYVSVSESDGVSLALLEAMAIGAIPVLSDIPANRTWVNDGATGAIVDIEPRSIADGIVRASGLDRDRVIQDNRSLVAEHADRETNLSECELVIDALVGVDWDPRPVADSDAA